MHVEPFTPGCMCVILIYWLSQFGKFISLQKLTCTADLNLMQYVQTSFQVNTRTSHTWQINHEERKGLTGASLGIAPLHPSEVVLSEPKSVKHINNNNYESCSHNYSKLKKIHVNSFYINITKKYHVTNHIETELVILVNMFKTEQKIPCDQPHRNWTRHPCQYV
jgi:hypothetical protein